MASHKTLCNSMAALLLKTCQVPSEVSRDMIMKATELRLRAVGLEDVMDVPWTQGHSFTCATKAKHAVGKADL